MGIDGLFKGLSKPASEFEQAEALHNLNNLTDPIRPRIGNEIPVIDLDMDAAGATLSTTFTGEIDDAARFRALGIGYRLIDQDDLSARLKTWLRYTKGTTDVGPVYLFSKNDSVVLGAYRALVHARDKLFVVDDFATAGDCGIGIESSTGGAYLRLRGDTGNDTYRHALLSENDDLDFLFGTTDNPDSMTLAGRVHQTGNLEWGTNGTDIGFTYLAGQPLTGIMVQYTAASTNRAAVVAASTNNAAKSGFVASVGNGTNQYSAFLYQNSDDFVINITNNTAALATASQALRMSSSSQVVTWELWQNHIFEDASGNQSISLWTAAGNTTVFNDFQADIDYKIESDSREFAFFLDAGANYIQTDTGRVRRTDRITTGGTTLDQSYDIVVCDTDGGAFTITLPASPLDGTTYLIKNVGSSANNLTVGRNGNTIDGAAADDTVGDGVAKTYVFETTEGWQTW